MSGEPSLFWQVFGENGLLTALFGALGGAVRAAALKTTWREGLRVVFIGTATSFGVGALAPFVLKRWGLDIPTDMSGALGTLCAGAFLVGLISVTLIERLISTAEREGGNAK